MKHLYLIFILALLVSAVDISCSKRKLGLTPAQLAEQSAPPSAPEQYPLIIHPLQEGDTLAEASDSRKYFLRNSELWTIDTLSNDETQITFTRGKIHKFYCSPSTKYVACLHEVAITKEPGIFEHNKAPDRSIYSIMVIRLADGKLIREFDSPPNFDQFLEFGRWLSKSRLFCYTSDGFAIGTGFLYDAFRDSLQQVREDYDRHQ
jgi:hypothetical protein